MNAVSLQTLGIAALFAGAGVALAEPADPRLRELTYDPGVVVTVPVMRGVVTHVLLDADETITEVASGLGSDCSKPEATWCIAAQSGGRSIFIKPKSNATSANNLAVVTDKRTHSFRFVVLAEGDDASPIYRLVVRAPAVHEVEVARSTLPTPTLSSPPAVQPAKVVTERLKASESQLVNSSYSIAEGTASEDIVPALVFDDGRFTYLRLPGNRQIPAVFDVLGDGSEALVNTRMEGDLLVVDRVSRRLMLRAGAAVVGVWNDDFDLEGRPPLAGTSVAGVQRLIKSEQATTGPHPGGHR